MPMLNNTPLLPPWLGLPIAGAVLIVIAAHVLALQRSDIDLRRKRIRTANGLLMMFVTALLAYAFCIVTPAQSAAFVLTWLAVVGLLTIVIVVAFLDVLNTLKLQARSRRELRREAFARATAAHPAPQSESTGHHAEPNGPGDAR